MIYALLLSVLTPVSQDTQHWVKLPDWAQTALAGADLANPPEGADLWRILDETWVMRTDDGKTRRERRIVQYVVKEGGSDRASVFFIDSDEHSLKVKKIKGWHVNRKGRFDKLDKDNVVTVGRSNIDAVTSESATLALFTNVAAGSIVVFQSSEIQESLFSIGEIWVSLPFPIKQRVIRLFVSGNFTNEPKPQIVPLALDTWNLKYELGPSSITIWDIPAFEDEYLSPDYSDPYPRLVAGFLSGDDIRLSSWDGMAKWYHAVFSQKAGEGASATAPRAATLEDLSQIAAYFNQKISYRQRYLTPDRGWIPASGQDVERRAYGDCKDMVACLSLRAGRIGLEVLPVLANIADGPRTSETTPCGPFFNHLIGAVSLKQSLGLAAEFEIGDGRYLLVDPTSKHTPVGMLPSHYRGRQVMMCTPAGAKWLTIPDTALEKSATAITVRGIMDQNFTLAGTVEITEEGDAHFLRTLSKNSNPREMEWAFRQRFDVPAIVELTQVHREIDEGNRLQVIYQTKWPSFLQRDAGGFRPPHGMIGRMLPRLTKRNGERKLPIALQDKDETVWTLEIRSKVPLHPGLDEAQWQDDYRAFHWRATGGNDLRIGFRTKGNSVYFSKDEIEKGLAYWRTYREKFNDFWLNGTLFQSR